MPLDAARRDRLDLELLRRYHDHDDLLARDAMVERAMPLVRHIARRFAARGEPLDDLVQVGSVGLVKAIDRFDPHSGRRFVSFAVPTVEGEIKRHFRDHSWSVHVTRGVQELGARVAAARSELEHRDGTAPDVAAIAAHLGTDLAQTREAIEAMRNYRALSLDRPAADGDGVLADGQGVLDPGYRQVEDRQLVDDAVALLDHRARRIVRERFLEGRLQREIAQDVGVTQMQVSRIITASLVRMREGLEDAGGDRLAA